MAQPNAAPAAQGYDLVVIGSSAGGIEALSTLVASLPTDFAAALVIAQHLDPAHVSHLGEILARRTALPVRTVVAQEPLVPGVIYVVPADRDVVITDHEVKVLLHGKTRSTPSVNRLFSSAAQAHGERLIGVILTGAGSDGASGARDVKIAGGTVIIENPATAAYASMPQSLAPSSIDLVVDLPQIGPLLADLVAGAYIPSPTEADTALPALLDHVHERTGIDFSTYKPPTILRRLQRRMALTHRDTLAAYQQYVFDHPEEYDQLAASFLIKVTEFFRDPEFFAALRDEVLPALIAQVRAEGRALRLWSAGCATGEEAYSLAILLADLLGDDLDHVPVRIFATDVDADAIAFARRGVYPASAVASLPAAVVARAFTVVDGAYEITPTIRNLVIFGQHDLGVRAPFPQMDLVLCRNVLIYFTSELQRRTLHLFAFALRDGGYLGLGKAETPAPFVAYFAPVLPTLKLYRRHGARVVVVPPPRLAPPPHQLAVRSSPRRLPVAAPVPLRTERGTTASDYVGTLLLQSAVGVVAVDRHYDIQAINRAGQQVLGIFRAALGEDLIHLVPQELAVPLRGAIDAAFAHQATLTELIVTMTSGVARSLQITAIMPPSDPAMPTPDAVLLHITDVTARVQAAAARQPVVDDTAAAPPASPRQRQQAWTAEREQMQAEITRLTTQLAQVHALNQTLHAANDEVATVNLTITDLNEDLLVRNEELQASSEEIKTLNEELQATNEELETLNEEMEATVEELHATNDDLVARTNEVQHLAALREEQRQASEVKAVELATILRCMGDAVLVVNQDGATQLTNAAYDALFGATRLIEGVTDEEGQPLTPAALPHQRVLAGTPFRMIFTQPAASGERRWFEATGEPLRLDGVVSGGVLTIRDITDRSLRRLQDEFLALASHELRSPLTAISTATQMLERRMQTADERERALVTMMRTQIHRLQQLIADLVDVTRLQSGKVHLTLAPVEVSTLITQTIAAFSVTTPQPPVVVVAPEPLMFLGDVVRLEQILTNLLTNASKYAAQSPQILVRAQQVDDEVVIQVQDSGPGIAADALPHLFQRYYQVRPDAEAAHGGLGLGLFITQELVVAQAGRIAVTSQVGQGTTFTLHFPLLSATVPVVETRETDASRKHTG